MKPFAPTLALACAALLAACAGPAPVSSSSPEPSLPSESATSAGTASSSSASSSEAEKSLSFAEAIDLLLSIEQSETGIRKETRISRSGRDAFEKEEVETLLLHEDGTSSSTGEIFQTGKEAIPFARRVEFVPEKIRGTDGKVYEMTRRYEVQDFADPSGTKSDLAYKLYVLPSLESAEGFPEDSYILEADKALESTLRLQREFIETVAALSSSPYLPQVGVTGFDASPTAQGILYRMEGSYSLTEEYIRTDYLYRSSFTLSPDKARVLSFSHRIETKDVNVADPADFSVAFTETSASFEYGDALPIPEGALDTSEYFLRQVERIELLDSAREPLEGNACALGATSYLFARPSAYSPASASDIDEYSLTPHSTSSPETIAIETSGNKSYFAPKALGKSTIGFVYYGLGEDGVYDLQEIAVEIEVVAASIQSLSLGGIFTPSVSDATLILGKTYRQTVSKSPSYAQGNILAVSSDPNVIEVEIHQGTLTLTPLASGVATIDVYVEGSPEIKASETLRVADPISPENLPALLSSGPWHYKDLYNWETTFYFEKDGAGRYDVVSGSFKGTGTFSWTTTLKGSLTLKGFQGDEADFLQLRFGSAPGTVTVGSEKTTLSFECEELYKTYVLTLKNA